MTVTNAMIAGIVSSARSVFPGATRTLHWGSHQENSVSCLASESTENSSEGDLGGVISGVRGTLRVILSECSPWTPPKTDDVITIDNADGEDMGTFTVLDHNDDPSGTVRKLMYGEASA